jgi:hypothetical protein
MRESLVTSPNASYGSIATKSSKSAYKVMSASTPIATNHAALQYVAKGLSGLVRRSKRSQLIRRFGIEHVIRCQRTSNTFEGKLTHRLDRDRVFDRRENARTD